MLYGYPDKFLHGFDNISTTRRPLAICLSVIFAKIDGKSSNHVQRLLGAPVVCVVQLVSNNENELIIWDGNQIQRLAPERLATKRLIHKVPIPFSLIS